MSYECRHECGAKPGSYRCFHHLLRKLAEEVGEVLEACANYHYIKGHIPFYYGMARGGDAEKRFEEARKAKKKIVEEFRDVLKIVEGIKKYHPWILEEAEEEAEENEKAIKCAWCGNKATDLVLDDEKYEIIPLCFDCYSKYLGEHSYGGEVDIESWRIKWLMKWPNFLKNFVDVINREFRWLKAKAKGETSIEKILEGAGEK